jgi:hypothetical protein
LIATSRNLDGSMATQITVQARENLSNRYGTDTEIIGRRLFKQSSERTPSAMHEKKNTEAPKTESFVWGVHVTPTHTDRDILSTSYSVVL